MALLKIKAGWKCIYQTKKMYISKKTTQSFIRAADQTFSTYNRSEQPPPRPDLFKTGFQKLQEIFYDEYTHKHRSRFCWGSTQTKDIPYPVQGEEAAGVVNDHLGQSFHCLHKHAIITYLFFGFQLGPWRFDS